ncbi:MAG: DivIVA domain-containing protein [Actinobacteria bacterium]|nr:DivIVA domain-containing protein [Actinomycetota bacterium]
MDRVVDTLNAAPGTEPVTVAQVQSVRFTATKFRDGYEQDQVDTFLDEVVATLQERALVARQVPLTQVPPRDPPPLVAGALTASELLSRLQLARAVQVSTAPDTVLLRLPDGTARGLVDVRVTPDGLEVVAG